MGSYNSSTIQVDVNYPSFPVDTLEDTSVTIAPAAPSGYTCTPPIPQGELTTSGTLMISSGLDTSAHIC